ncbi:MAG: GNAT family N-acetyltransferase [Bacteroidales bacterium]|nr:GNAT family N-acetyltransferase [Bacteroidales bacterium]
MIRGKNIELRAVEPTDVDLLYAWENDESLWHLSNTLTPFSRFDIEQYVLNAGQDIFAAKQLRLMIVISDKAIGSIDLFDFEPAHKRAGVGIMVVKNERNKGYASEALHVLVEYCFNVLHLHQLFCNISADNQASISLFSKEGFEIIGLKKEWLLIRNKWVDEYILQLINR